MTQPANWSLALEPPATPGSQAFRIDASLAALLSMNSGATAPAYKLMGTLWLDTSASPHPIKIWTGIGWSQLGTLNPTTGAVIWALPALVIGDVSGLQAALDAKVPTIRTVSAGGLLSGGGALSGNISITGTGSTQGQAEAGVENTSLMTPLRTAQAIAALATPAAIGAATPAEVTAAIAAAILAHSGIAKASFAFNTSGTLLEGYGVSGIVENTSGRWTITLAAEMATTTYRTSVHAYPNASNKEKVAQVVNQTETTLLIECTNTLTGTLSESGVQQISVEVYGDLA